MKYKTLNDQLEMAISILSENKELMDVLDYISTLQMPNNYIAAGSVFQTIWNKMDNRDLNYNIKDIDVIYYNDKDLSPEKDLEYFKLINTYCKDKEYKYKIDVSNEARMHIWKAEMYGMDIEQYKSSEDAINKWIATVHAIGITKDSGKLKIYAPFGLSDIFSKTIRAIKHKYNTKDFYDNKVKSWKERFNGLTIIEY